MKDDIYGDNYMAHFGVKGMKWGTRKRRPSKSSISSMSDKQLRASVNRANLEKQYKASLGTTGKKFVKGSLATIGLSVVAAYTTKVIPAAIVKSIDSAAVAIAKAAKDAASLAGV